MHQISRVTHKDPSIEAILNKRAPYIENIYNRNLRPVLDKSDTASSANWNSSSLNLNSNSTNRISSSHNVNNNNNNNNNNNSNNDKTDLNITLTLERTDLSIGPIRDNDSDDFDFERNNYVSDGGIAKYEKLCYDLKIVPCSIILKSLPTTAISICNYGLNSAGVLALANALKENLTVTKVDLTGNEIGPHGAKHLVSLFEENSTISELNISKNFIGSEGMKYIIEIFKKNRFLRSVDLSNNDFSDDDGVLLIEAIEEHLVAKLNLSQNKFAEKSGIAIGKWLADNGSLVEFNLGWNHIRKKAALAVAKGIWENNKLVKINLAWNGFGNEGAVAVGKALLHNVTLEELDMRCNRIGPPGIAGLFSSLKENSSLKRIFVGKNHVNNQVFEMVLKMLTTINPLTLELIDISDVSFKNSIEEQIQAVKAVHPEFKCVYGFLNFAERRSYNPSMEAIRYIQEYCEKNNVSLMDLFAKLDTDGSMSVSYDEFKEGLKQSGIPITPAQIEALIVYLDRDGDGEIDFSELVIGEEQVRKADSK